MEDSTTKFLWGSGPLDPQYGIGAYGALCCKTQCYKCLAVAEMGDRLTTIDGPKIEGLYTLWEKLNSLVTLCGLGRGLPSYQVGSWSIQPFGHNRHGPKIGGSALGGGGAGSALNTMLPGRGLHSYTCLMPSMPKYDITLTTKQLYSWRIISIAYANKL